MARIQVKPVPGGFRIEKWQPVGVSKPAGTLGVFALESRLDVDEFEATEIILAILRSCQPDFKQLESWVRERIN